MIAVIGDIHGCFHTLQNLIKKIKGKYTSIDIYSVGDLVDRGNFSYEVIEFVQSESIKFTPGNHDYMMYYFIKQPTSEIGKPWLYNGFETTLISYDKHFDKLNDHLDLIINQPLFFNLTDCFISHAGISKQFKKDFKSGLINDSSALEDFVHTNLNGEHGILWTRDTLLDIGKLQIVGHSIKKEVTFVEASNVAYIDTGVYLGNKLSAVIVDRNKIIELIEEKVQGRDLGKAD